MKYSKNIIYISILIFFGILAALSLFYTGRFFATNINNSFQLDQAKIDQSTNLINAQKLNKVGARLGL